MRGTSRTHLILGILGIFLLVGTSVGVTLAASAGKSSPAGQATTASDAGSSGYTTAGPARAGVLAGAATGAVRQVSSSPAVSYPAWCCSAGNPLGLTATGQATVRGAGSAARTLAIARAVADARSQAKAAATASGISLGRIINMQLSVPAYPYPIPMGAASAPNAASAATGISAAADSSPPTTACRAGSPCLYPGISVYATVTVTWAIS
jgi:hypothetical protein